MMKVLEGTEFPHFSAVLRTFLSCDSIKELDGKWSPLESLESRHHFKGLKS